jgi:DNA-binding beta-propeller fold protein YncE
VSGPAYPYNPIGDIAVDPTSGTLIATHPRDCTVSIFDADDPDVAAAIQLDGDPVAVAAAVGRAFVVTTSASYDAVTVVDLNSKIVLSVHPLAFTVTGIAVSADGARVFAARTGRLGSDIAVVDVATAEIMSIPVAAPGASSIDVIRTGVNGQLYASVSSYRDGELAVVDTARQRVVATIPVGAPIRDITLSPDGAVAYVLAHHPHGAAAVIRIDLVRRAIGAVVEVSESAIQVAMSPDGADIYVVDRDGIAVLCALTERVFDSITVDVRPSCVAMSSAASRLYVADHVGDVTVLPVATLVLEAVAG